MAIVGILTANDFSQLYTCKSEVRVKDEKIIEVSQADAQRLMRIATSESGNQGVDGMGLVMQTVWNRVQSDKFPNTVREVITQEGQFESYNNGAYDDVEISSECHLALAQFEGGAYKDQPIIGFEIAGNRTLDKYFQYAFTLKGHDFYIWK